VDEPFFMIESNIEVNNNPNTIVNEINVGISNTSNPLPINLIPRKTSIAAKAFPTYLNLNIVKAMTK